MGVPCDVMLNDQSTSFHDAAGVRQRLGARPGARVPGMAGGPSILRGRRLVVPDGHARRQLAGDLAAILGGMEGRRIGTADARPARPRRAVRHGPDAGAHLR